MIVHDHPTNAMQRKKTHQHRHQTSTTAINGYDRHVVPRSISMKNTEPLNSKDALANNQKRQTSWITDDGSARSHPKKSSKNCGMSTRFTSCGHNRRNLDECKGNITYERYTNFGVRVVERQSCTTQEQKPNHVTALGLSRNWKRKKQRCLDVPRGPPAQLTRVTVGAVDVFMLSAS